MQRHILQSVILFLGLTAAAAVMLLAAQSMPEAFGRAVLLQMSCVIFGSGLTVMLLQLLNTSTTERSVK